MGLKINKRKTKVTRLNLHSEKALVVEGEELVKVETPWEALREELI